MANQLLSAVQDLGNLLECTVGVLDTNGVVVACSDPTLMNTTRVGLSFIDEESDVLQRGGYCYRYVDLEQRREIVFVEHEGEAAVRNCRLAALGVSGKLDRAADRNDLCTFVKNVVTDNILPSDLYIRARDLGFPVDLRTAALVIRVSEGAHSVQVLDIVTALFPEKFKDFIFNVSDRDTVLIKSVTSTTSVEDLMNLAISISDMLETQHQIRNRIGIGDCVDGVRDMTLSFRQARTALEIGMVFDIDQPINAYSKLGIARLIYQLPTTICEQFLSEVFRPGSLESLDQETLFTIQRFFENNLNVSETSRGLFVHRNTLVYRLEKIKKVTGLDLREFDQAIIFKIAMMVRKYLDSIREM